MNASDMRNTEELWYSYNEMEARRNKYRTLDDRDGMHLPDTNAADMVRCVSRLRAHLKPKHLLTWWILAQFIGAAIYLAQLASMHFGGAQ